MFSFGFLVLFGDCSYSLTATDTQSASFAHTPKHQKSSKNPLLNQKIIANLKANLKI